MTGGMSDGRSTQELAWAAGWGIEVGPPALHVAVGTQ